MSPSIVPPQKGSPPAANLPTATASYDSAARHFIIEPTPWGTVFVHRRIIHAAFPWGPIDAYVELPLSDSLEDKGKLLDTSISRIKIESSEAVPEGAHLARLYGDDEVWMLHFPPQPLKTGVAEKTMGKEGVKAGKKAEVGGRSNDKSWWPEPEERDPSFHKVCPNFWHFLKMILTEGKKSPTFLDDFFTAYAIDCGLTANDVRVDFANEIADADTRLLYPDDRDKFWELLWQYVTQNGTLKGTASSHWKKGFDLKERPETSQARLALARRGKEIEPMEPYGYSIMRAMMKTTPDETLASIAKVYNDGAFREQLRRFDSRFEDDRYFDDIYSLFTRRGTVEGAPKHWDEKI